jgi:hypothetical protein
MVNTGNKIETKKDAEINIDIERKKGEKIYNMHKAVLERFLDWKIFQSTDFTNYLMFEKGKHRYCFLFKAQNEDERFYSYLIINESQEANSSMYIADDEPRFEVKESYFEENIEEVIKEFKKISMEALKKRNEKNDIKIENFDKAE